MKVLQKLQQANAYGYESSWALVTAGAELGYFRYSDISDYAVQKIENATDEQLPAIACLTSHSLTRNEQIGYLVELCELENSSTWLAKRQWLLIELALLLKKAEQTLQKTDIEEEDDPRINEIFYELTRLQPLLETLRDQEPIWMPEIFGYGFPNPLAVIVQNFHNWLEKEKHWIENEISIHNKGKSHA
ncbi:MAG: hypothetical protein RLZZ156_456 [Deinococcota bacterium]|jgi:hypothetical protein